MKKVLSLFALLMLAITSAWADVEQSGNQGSSNVSIIGSSYSLDGKFIAGKGGVQQGNMPDKGVKLRSNQGNLVFEVNAGYKITKFEFWACGNTTTAIDIVSATVDGGENLLSSTVTIPGKGETTSADLVFSDIAAVENVTLTFAEGSNAQLVGTWKITYEQMEVVVQEITEVTLNGSAVSEEDLATLKSTKQLTIDGTSLNGVGIVGVKLSSGATTVTRSYDGTSAIYTFTINGSDAYTIIVTNIVKTYTQQGSVVAFSVDGENAEGVNTGTVTLNGITISMVEDKTFQYGTGKVTLGEKVYVPLKLSTGSAVNVTFPEGKVATKVIVYGWSANGNGKLAAMKETNAEDAKSVDVSNDVYFATNTADDIYPSVYEYELDNWESFYFNPGGSPSQPFVVLDFVLATPEVAPVETTATFNFADPNIRENIGTAMTDVAGYIYNETFTADGATLQITGGSAPSRIYEDANRGQCLVIYTQYASLTFRAPEGKAITKIEFTAAGNSNINKFTASSGAIEGMTWTGNAEGVRFLQGATSYLANAIVTLVDKDAQTTALPAIEYTECENIAAFNALEAGTYAKLKLTDAEVIGISADGYSTAWVQDATGGCWVQYTSLNAGMKEKTKGNGFVYCVKRLTSGNSQVKETEDTPKSEIAGEAIAEYSIVEGSTISEVNVPANLNKVVKLTGASFVATSATAGTLTIGEETISVNNGTATANQQLHKLEWAKGDTMENVTIVAILVAASATDASKNQLLPISMVEEQATGITNVNAVNTNATIYNLQGIRLNKVQRGLNIVDGKKIIIK